MSEATVAPAAPPPATTAPGITPSEAAALVRSNEQLQASLASAQGRIAEMEQRSIAAARSTALAGALAGFGNVIPAAIPQLERLIAPELSVHHDPQAGPVVCGPAMTPLESHLKTVLARPDFAHFLRPQSTGGTGGASAAGQSAPTPAAFGNPAPQPRNFSEAAILEAQKKMSTAGNPLVTSGLSVNPDGSITRAATEGFGGFGRKRA